MKCRAASREGTVSLCGWPEGRLDFREVSLFSLSFQRRVEKPMIAVAGIVGWCSATAMDHASAPGLVQKAQHPLNAAGDDIADNLVL
ncbi:MAG: hypothetical protein RLZ97_2331 [Verrucomicrobiota bacterium]